jgi:hypothetical protein
MQHIQSIMVMAGDPSAHRVECDSGKWHIANEYGRLPKVYPNIISALSALERVTGGNSNNVQVAHPDCAVIPINRHGFTGVAA